MVEGIGDIDVSAGAGADAERPAERDLGGRDSAPPPLGIRVPVTAKADEGEVDAAQWERLRLAG